MTAYAPYSASAHKLLTDQRETYFLQSKLGCDYAEAKRYAEEQAPDEDYETELAEAASLKYGDWK